MSARNEQWQTVLVSIMVSFMDISVDSLGQHEDHKRNRPSDVNPVESDV